MNPKHPTPSFPGSLPFLICTTAILLAATATFAAPQKRWLYLQTNLLPDNTFSNAIALLERAAGEGYTGVLLTDSKFMRWDDLPDAYLTHCQSFRDTCRRLKLELVAGIMPIGYSNSLLSRNPNLAEGLPVRDAPFVVRNGRLEPVTDFPPLINPGFEKFGRSGPTGWSVDSPNEIAFQDSKVFMQGKSSLRFQDVARHEPSHRHARAIQTLRLSPYRNYHLSVSIKTRDWTGDDNRVTVIDKKGRALNFQTPAIEPTQDWKRFHIVFNTLESSTVNLYLGTWAGESGTLWWDDVSIEPAGFVNVLRRPGTPLLITTDDGATILSECRDFNPVVDPKLGTDPYAGEFTVWHEPPVVTLRPGSSMKEGQRVRASYYHPAIIYAEQISCCMSEPGLYDILAWQLDKVRNALAPDGYMMMHDEIRTQGWDAACSTRKLTCSEILASNLRRCIALIHKADPGKPLYIWSDMFDPNHNAKEHGNYFLVKGEGPWYGAWQTLPANVTIVNWQMSPATRRKSLEHFSKLGHHQILAGYYDGDPAAITGWLRDAAGIPGVDGVMYTTWRHDFQHTAAFLKAATP
jgi:hypothetical protein